MNRLTFNGLSSGIDTESVVKAMLQPYQSKVDSAKKDKVLMEWKKEAWKDINSKILNFHQKFISASRLQGTFDKKNVTTSHPDMITINPGSTLPEGSHKLKVGQLAETARLETEKVKVNNSGIDVKKDTTLEDLGIKAPISFTIKDKDGKDIKTVTIDTTYTEIDDEGKSVVKNKTISQFQSDLQKEMPDANVNFDENAGAFFISSKKSGKENGFSIEAKSEADAVALRSLGLLKDGATSAEAVGQDAIVYYNGVEVKSSSNQISVNGLNVTILKADINTEINLISTQDKEVIVDFVKDFVSEYNKLIEEVNGLLNEKVSRDFKPLTDEEKKAMTEEEIKLWEKKAKEGLLRNDPILEKFKGSMREILGSKVDTNPDGFKMLSDIGISTGDWREGGKLHIDENKLRKAIEQNSDAVMSLFTKQKDESQAKADYEKKNPGKSFDSLDKDYKDKLIGQTGGLGMQMFDTMEIMFRSRANEKSSNFLFSDKMLDTQIQSKDIQISKLQDQFDKMETYYYNRFATMEKMMAQLNSQTAFLGQMGGM